MKGIREWESAAGYKVLEVHYTADPSKDNDEWRARAKKGISPGGWAREYEINWSRRSGSLLFSGFKRGFHTRKLAPVHPQAVLLRWWDFGYHWPVIGIGQISGDDRFIVRGSFCMEDVGREIFLNRALAWCAAKYGSQVHYHDFCDFAGTHMVHTAELTDVQFLATKGVYAECRSGREVPGVNLIRALLELSRPLDSDSGESLPVFIVDEDAEEYVEGFLSGFVEDPKLPDQCQGIHPYIDLLDGLRYCVKFVYEPETVTPYSIYKHRPAQAEMEEELQQLLREKRQESRTSAVPWSSGR